MLRPRHSFCSAAGLCTVPLLATGILYGIALAPASVSPASAKLCDPTLRLLLDERRSGYREDDASDRTVAEIHVRLLGSPNGVRIEIRASAIGPMVDGAEGFGGIRGANRVAAQQIASLLERGTVRVLTYENGSSLPLPGRVAPGRRDRIPERTVGPAGLELLGSTPEVLVELVADGAEVGRGTHRTIILAHGVPRLRVEYEAEVSKRGGNGSWRGRILEIRSLGASTVGGEGLR